MFRTSSSASETTGGGWQHIESLAPFLLGEHGQAVVATSLVASGIQAWPAEDMPPLLEAATQWLSKGLSMSCLKIVEYSPTKADTLKRLFANFKRGFQTPRESDGVTFRYDAFVSYAHKDSADVDIVVQDLLVRRKDLRLFVDRVSLREGSAWPQELYEALDSCRKVIVVLSPPYLASKHCKFEFNVALLRQNDSAMDVILPIYLQTTGLPTYMRLLQHFDCRERDAVKLKLACGEILASIYNQH